MQVIHLSQKELAERWRMSEATLEHWRSDRIGPVFLKILGRVLYRLIDIEEFEVASLRGAFNQKERKITYSPDFDAPLVISSSTDFEPQLPRI